MEFKSTHYSLNSFQQMMLKWTALTPYNAGHVMHISGMPDAKHWQRVTLQVIQELKLGSPEFFQNDKVVQFNSLEDLQIETPELNLDSHINAELNRPFLKNEFPIRFFIISEDEQSYYFGAIYNHWIADSYAMRALFQRIFTRYQNDNSQLTALTLSAPPLRVLFGKYLGKISLLNGIKTFLKYILHFQSAYRVKFKNIMDFHTGFDRYYLSDGLIQKLTDYTKTHGVSINDLFLAVLAKTMGDYTSSDRANKKRKRFRLFARNRLALGTIVDVRYPVYDQLKNVFGQYLSNYTLILKNPENTSFSKLLKTIHTRTLAIKNKMISIKNFASWDVSLYTWKFLSNPKSQARFFTKNTPVIAGISNVNLTPSWIGKEEKIADYIRISPTGLLLPLTFTITTLHERLSLCVSYRTAAFSKADIENLSQSFIKQLESIE